MVLVRIEEQYTEMKILDKFGLDIQNKKEKNPSYYIGARDFELQELRLLAYVAIFSYITEKVNQEFIRSCYTGSKV